MTVVLILWWALRWSAWSKLQPGVCMIVNIFSWWYKCTVIYSSLGCGLVDCRWLIGSISFLSGTPSPKKMVRFADAMGLDLEKVRLFLQDQLPNTPSSYQADVAVATLTNELNRHSTDKYLTPSFPQPCLAGNFLERIRMQKVSLDSVQTSDFQVSGFVRVLNIAFDKALVVRYTFNNWKTSLDLAAQYVPNSNDNFSDRFQFSIHAPLYFDVGEVLQFCLCFKANGQEFWDNNFGQNYCLTCCIGGGIPGFNALPHSPSTNAFL